jgi:hypothetical protein
VDEFFLTDYQAVTAFCKKKLPKNLELIATVSHICINKSQRHQPTEAATLLGSLTYPSTIQHESHTPSEGETDAVLALVG